MKNSVGHLLSLASTLTLYPSTAILAQNSNPVAIIRIEGPGIAGQATLVESALGFVTVRVDVKGDPKILTPGLHGIHFHAVGSCTSGATPFSDAGGHFDPGPLGSSTPVEVNHPYHSGDLPNLIVDEQGRGTLLTITSRISLADSPTIVFDADGTAIIIHALQDQIKPGGTAAEAGGSRLACGVIQRGSSKSQPPRSEGWNL